jgi:diguanylate cyclase (GGDEF)-like protein
VAAQAWATRAPVLVRRLDPDDDPTALALLPEARNVVALHLPLGDSREGVIVLEHGGHPLKARVPRRRLAMLGQFTAHATLALRSAQLLEERERIAAQDGLTGLANRREFDRTLRRDVGRAVRTGEPLSLIVFDVDHFKAINDNQGHLAGDDVLRQLSGVLIGAVREMDLVARYGGEEFAVILPRCDREDAARVAERVVRAVRDDPGLENVTLSGGLATIPANASSGLTLVEAADEAMYASKREGRNRLTASSRLATHHAESPSPAPEAEERAQPLVS